jgi:hypothetical protein
MTASKRPKKTPQEPEAPPPSSGQMEALARMIEYVSVEARENGLFLTAHLLDLAGWSVQEARSNADALAKQRSGRPRGSRAISATSQAVDSEKMN